MEIKTKDLTIKNLLEQGFYKIPRFQRPYSWDRENVDEFWNDVVVSDDSDYFIGSFVLYRDKSDPDLYFIVDGQQRLTTITVLLAAVRDALHELGQTPLASGVQKLIEREFLRWSKKDSASATGDMSFRDSQRLAIETLARDGEVLIQKLRGFDNEWGFSLRFPEADYLDGEHNRSL